MLVDFRAEASQHVQNKSDDDGVHADVEDGGRDELDVTEHGQPQLDDGALEHLSAEQKRRHTGGRRRGEADSQQGAGADGRGFPQFEPAAGEVADGQGKAGGEAAGEPAAGQVVAGEEEVQRKDDDGVEDEPRDDFEDDGSALGRQGPAGHEPGIAGGGGESAVHGQRRVVAGAAPDAAQPPHGSFGDGRGGPDAVPAPADEDQAGDAGRGQGQHGDLAEGVPGADINEGDVDDVQPAASLVRQPRELQGNRHRHARTQGIDGHEDHRDRRRKVR